MSEVALSESQSPPAPVPGATPEPVQLLSNDAVGEINGRVARDFERIAAELDPFPEEALRSRLKQYDNYDRLTFGRVLTGFGTRRELAPGNLDGRFHSYREDDPNRFPGRFSEASYPGVWDATRRSLQLLLENVAEEEKVMASVYCLRVLVRPAALYKGFEHRDTRAGQRCGTCVWYPRVDAEKLDGATLFCHLNDPRDPRRTLHQKPDFFFEIDRYRRGLLLMRYPENLFHGVLLGRHQSPPEEGRELRAGDFVRPRERDFVKDLLVVTVSESSTAEE